MWFKNIVAHQRDADALRFSEDGFWAVFGMRLKTKVKERPPGHLRALSEGTISRKTAVFLRGLVYLGDILAMHPRPKLGGQGPKAVPLPDPK